MEADLQAVWTVVFWSLVGASVGALLMLGINLLQNPPWSRSEDEPPPAPPPSGGAREKDRSASSADSRQEG
jgi:hypothetical protein